jgi:hypothetical protein
VLVSARRFPELGVLGVEADEIAEMTPIAASPRHLQAIELVGDHPEDAATPPALPEGDSAATR